MKNNILKYMACAAMALGLAANVQAAQMITGGLSLSGGYTTDSGVLGTATAFTAFNNVVVASGATGSYAGLAGTPVTMFGFSFNPATLPVTPLWVTSPGGIFYTFDLTSMTVTTHTSSELDISGSGMLRITGFADTVGTWQFGANSLGDTFSFSSSNGANVPDGGTTALLLGAALSALGLIRRKLA
jgi:hypothetical protein